MKIENNQAIQASDFADIAEHFSCPISLEIQNFLDNYNGNIVTSVDTGIEITFITDQGESISDGFPIVYHTNEIINQLQYIDYIEGLLDDSNWSEDDVEADKLLPLMSVYGGSINLYIAVCGVHEGKLFVVDNGDYGVSKVNLSLADLTKQLEF